MSVSIKPLEDRIVVKPLEAEQTTASGLVIPDTAKEKPQQGEVLAVGPGKRSEQTGDIIPVDVKVGDTVMYSKYGGTEITIEGEDLLILNARDVLAVVATHDPLMMELADHLVELRVGEVVGEERRSDSEAVAAPRRG